MASLIGAVRGMRDLIGEEAELWQQLLAQVADTCAAYGYEHIATPLLEREELFVRSVGSDTDIIAKELYSFEDKGGERLCLRPEATASVLRALAAAGRIGSSLARVWYAGPMFRRERPQRGRYRQFHQFGAEATGSDSPLLDAEMILLCARLWRKLGIIDSLELQINNLGSADERRAYRERLQEYLRSRQADLDDTARARLESNPLRILDSKDEQTLAALAEAPELNDFLGEQSRSHLAQVLDHISGEDLPVTENRRLVRGLDYYNLTVFEWVIKDEQRRQNAIAGGGRYDALARMLGAPAAPGVGFAAGIERIIELGARAARVQSGADVFVAAGEDAVSPVALARVSERLRDAGLTVIQELRSGKIRELFRRADRSAAQVAVVIGKREAAAGTATVKHLRRELAQREVGQGDLAAAVQEMINQDQECK
ncbi:MAG: histidine--tRNA ligase [Betaproteobacteria bacterium]|nr:histidine--tRNA ligase [Betaproteobacteria bacterium]